MTKLKRTVKYLALGAAASLFSCATSGTDAPPRGGSGSCNPQTNCQSCQDCMTACVCATADENACRAACGDGPAQGGSGGLSGSGGTFGSGGSGASATGGSSGSGGFSGSSSVGGAGGVASGGGSGVGGAGGVSGSSGVGGSSGTGSGTGTCCTSGDCLCHGPDPSGLTSKNGPYTTTSYALGSIGTVHYPTNGEAPFAAIAIVPGFTNTGPEMAPWGTFYASWGIVTSVTNTVGTDDPNIRATKLLAAITALKAENTTSGSPLFGKLAGRYGTSGYSMGGGGTTIASGQDSTLKTSIGLAAWGPNGSGVQVPTLLLCGSADTVAACSMSQTAYTAIPGSTQKMMVTIAGATHFNWFSPTDVGGNSGETALAFQKVYLEGDERWKPILKQSRGTVTTNIQ